jgi:NADPH2:quinone reductase
MRAWEVTRHGAPREALRLGERAAPSAGGGLVRIRVAAAGLGLPDLLLCRGSYALTPALPFVPGQEAAGTVLDAGASEGLQPGERVLGVTAFPAGAGGCAEQALLYADFALPAPDSLADAEAAAFAIPFHTAWVGLVQRARLAAGETLLVLGAAGGAGSAALQLGRAVGARVIAAARGPEKAAFCRALGANVVLDPEREPLVESVRAASGGRGADVIYDPVGGAPGEAALGALAREGRLLLVGFAAGGWPRHRAGALVERNVSLLGVMPSGYDRAFRLAAHARMLEWLRAGRLRVPVARVAAFEELPAALEELGARGVCGKLVLTGP